jgi:hypothetical protein
VHGEAMTEETEVRINELARQLEVKAEAIVNLLPGLGLTEKKTHSSHIPIEIAEKVREALYKKGEPPVFAARSEIPRAC